MAYQRPPYFVDRDDLYDVVFAGALAASTWVPIVLDDPRELAIACDPVLLRDSPPDPLGNVSFSVRESAEVVNLWGRRQWHTGVADSSIYLRCVPSQDEEDRAYMELVGFNVHYPFGIPRAPLGYDYPQAFELRLPAGEYEIFTYVTGVEEPGPEPPPFCLPVPRPPWPYGGNLELGIPTSGRRRL